MYTYICTYIYFSEGMFMYFFTGNDWQDHACVPIWVTPLESAAFDYLALGPPVISCSPMIEGKKSIAKPEQVLTAKLCHLRRRAKNGEVRVLQIWDRFGLSLKNYERRLFARQVVVSFKKFHPHVISWWSCTDRRTNITIRETTCARSSV